MHRSALQKAHGTPEFSWPPPLSHLLMQGSPFLERVQVVEFVVDFSSSICRNDKWGVSPSLLQPCPFFTCIRHSCSITVSAKSNECDRASLEVENLVSKSLWHFHIHDDSEYCDGYRWWRQLASRQKLLRLVQAHNYSIKSRVRAQGSKSALFEVTEGVSQDVRCFPLCSTSLSTGSSGTPYPTHWGCNSAQRLAWQTSTMRVKSRSLVTVVPQCNRRLTY